MTEINNRIKKILDNAYGLTPITRMGEAPQRVPMCDIDGIAREICQLFPQPLEGVNLESPKDARHEWDKTGDKELAQIFRDASDARAKYAGYDKGYVVDLNPFISRVRALLQPKIEEARKLGIRQAIDNLKMHHCKELRREIDRIFDGCYSKDLSVCPNHTIFQCGKAINELVDLSGIVDVEARIKEIENDKL